MKEKFNMKVLANIVERLIINPMEPSLAKDILIRANHENCINIIECLKEENYFDIKNIVLMYYMKRKIDKYKNNKINIKSEMTNLTKKLGYNGDIKKYIDELIKTIK